MNIDEELFEKLVRMEELTVTVLAERAPYYEAVPWPKLAAVEAEAAAAAQGQMMWIVFVVLLAAAAGLLLWKTGALKGTVGEKKEVNGDS